VDNELFVMVLALGCGAILWWGCVRLPRADRQIIASVPIGQTVPGLWAGLNLTYYGLILATAQCIAVTLFCILMGSLGYPPWMIGLPAGVMLMICIPASKIVARLVEKKKNTFTVGGASFVGFIVSPFILSGINAGGFVSIPVLPFLAALAVSYAIGEGIGRLGCISFGCCYGKPLGTCPPSIARLFSRFHFRFSGRLKKAAYEGGFDNVPLVPVQALTSVFYFIAGLLSTYLFLNGHYRLSFLAAVLVTQSWRFASEFLRSDHRGGGRLSIYQFMSVAMIAYSFFIVSFLHSATVLPQSVSLGLKNVATLPFFIAIEMLWAKMFFYVGKSKVTGSDILLYVRKDRI